MHEHPKRLENEKSIPNDADDLSTSASLSVCFSMFKLPLPLGSISPFGSRPGIGKKREKNWSGSFYDWPLMGSACSEGPCGGQQHKLRMFKSLQGEYQGKGRNLGRIRPPPPPHEHHRHNSRSNLATRKLAAFEAHPTQTDGSFKDFWGPQHPVMLMMLAKTTLLRVLPCYSCSPWLGSCC